MCFCRQRLAEFIESEAELSGDDVGSDDEEDEEDIYANEYEKEKGEELRISKGKLLEQVSKAHQ